jgi:MbtH protein
MSADHVVVVNDEEQYSVWPERRPLPAGWRSAGVTGSKAECLAYIENVWTDMRPKSLRERMDAEAVKQGRPRERRRAAELG